MLYGESESSRFLAAVRRFKELVAAEGLNVTVRDTRGREADAACGQLHERVMKQRAAAVS